MPFNDGTKRIAALYAFVDQFIAGDSAMRSSFDQVFGDLVNSVNELAEYLEASAAAGADQRYMGRLVAVPTTRLDAAPLEEGDFYVAAHADAGQTLAWMRSMAHTPEQVFVVHGEMQAADILRQRIAHELRWHATVPEHGSTLDV